MVNQITTPDALKANGSLGFVPTMGALHAGHMALVERAQAENDAVVVSIFVNPLQFGAGEDLEAYPRPLEDDLAKLEAAGVEYAYTPSVETMYPEGFQTLVQVPELSATLCGAARPGHFDGVATVVAKLLNQLQPSLAYFGEKDHQQLCIIRRMVSDLAIPTDIIGVPTLREVDGLAMSSRNAYLNESERAVAPLLYQTLCDTAEAMKTGTPADEALRTGEQTLLQKGFAKVDYLSLVDGSDLTALNGLKPGARLLAAAWLGKARLIDNIEV